MRLHKIENYLNVVQDWLVNKINNLGHCEVLELNKSIVLSKWFNSFIFFKKGLETPRMSGDKPGTPTDFISGILKGAFEWPSENIATSILSKYYSGSFVTDSDSYYTGPYCKVSIMHTPLLGRELANALLVYDYLPLDISTDFKNVCNLINDLRREKLIEFDSEKNISFIPSVVEKDGFKELLAKSGIKLDTPEDETITIDGLRNCENVRIGIEPYDETLLTEPNRGHWDLKKDVDIDGKRLIARDPHLDIKDDCVVGIDFGTKSTIVYFQNEDTVSLPMAIGQGDFFSKDSPYENPTVMHFTSINDFLYDYKEKKGRPSTNWADLTISWTAKREFERAKSKDYSEYIPNIKQWAGEGHRSLKFKSNKDNEIFTLKPFLDLGEDDLNPVELYAYFIGLYINNMSYGHGIFLDYYLSFPVTYKKEIKDKMIQSFERGLKKSLPVAILEDEEVMERFSLNGTISEPMAYASTALQEYGFNFKENDDDVHYAVFDFGGGTIDYDFGVWSKNKSRNKPYALQSFGGGGLGTKGGENLLEDLAFEIFKENREKLKDVSEEDGQYDIFPFHKGLNSVEFKDSYIYLEESVEANKNMRTLMEELRKYWEHSEEYLEKELPEDQDDIIKFNLNLFNKKGKEFPGMEITYTRKQIKDFIVSNISKSVESFFSALAKKAIVMKCQDFKIFLAGNSCKSIYVKKEFEKYTNSNETGLTLEIFYPLGSQDSYNQMRARNVEFDENDDKRPDGKTGVAYGLIECSSSGNIKIKSNVNETENGDIDFLYYIGYKDGKYFNPMELRDGQTTLPYNSWFEYVEADEKSFTIFYTKNAICADGKMLLTEGVKQKKLEVKTPSDDAMVYIRAIKPDTIQYVVSEREPNGDVGDLITVTFVD